MDRCTELAGIEQQLPGLGVKSCFLIRIGICTKSYEMIQGLDPHAAIYQYPASGMAAAVGGVSGPEAMGVKWGFFC